MHKQIKAVFFLVCSPLAFLLGAAVSVNADAYRVEILLDDSSSYNAFETFQPLFPHRADQANARDEHFTTVEEFITSRGIRVPTDCLLRNSTRWRVSYTIGLNDAGDLLTVLDHRDRPDISVIAALRATGQPIENYCPVITWDIDKQCRSVTFSDNIGVNGSDPRVRYWPDGALRFPVSTDRDFVVYSSGWHFSSPEVKMKPYCTVRVTVKAANGRPIPRQSFLLFGRPDGQNTKVLGAVRTDSRGQARMTFNIGSYVQKNFPGECSGLELNWRIPFNSEKWISRGFQATIRDHCV